MYTLTLADLCLMVEAIHLAHAEDRPAWDEWWEKRIPRGAFTGAPAPWNLVRILVQEKEEQVRDYLEILTGR